MIRRMLIPLDGSKVSEQVLPYARYLASKLEIPVDLLSVVDIVALSSFMREEKTRNLDDFITDITRRSEAYLETITTTLRGITVDWFVKKGNPGEVIIEKAKADSGTLIAMATHGRSGISRWLLGSVAEKVLRGTTSPLLLVRAKEPAKNEGEKTIKRVIVPLDGSPLAEKVLPHVTALAKELRFETVLLRAYNVRHIIAPYKHYIPDQDALEEEVRENVMSYLDGMVRALESNGVAQLSQRTSEKEAAQQIVDLASEKPDSLIAMCTHGRSGVKRWILGSVTENVVRHSTTPVLVIPMREKDHLVGWEKDSKPIDEMRDVFKYPLD
jgi:nucleotide-binding universal stress UspA family protein